MPGPNLWRSTRVLHIQGREFGGHPWRGPARPDRRRASPAALLLRLYIKRDLWEDQRNSVAKMKRTSAPAKPAPAPADEIMNMSSLALYLRCDKATIYRLLKRKQIPAFRLGSDWRFFRSAIDEWIAQHEITNPAPTRGRKPKVS
jgi:excisionase family DNA binding protein